MQLDRTATLGTATLGTATLALVMVAGVGCSSQKSAPVADVGARAEADARRVCGTCHVANATAGSGAGSGALAGATDAGVPDPDMLVATVRPPTFDELRVLPPAAIVASLEFGVMRDIGATLTPEQRIGIAEYLTGKPYDPKGATAYYCPRDASDVGAALGGASWKGWGNGVDNTRFQPAAAAKLDADSVRKLQLKWAFALTPGRAGSTLTSEGSRLYFGDQAGKVRSLDLKTGCTHWVFDAGRWVRTAVHLERAGGRTLACFGATQFPDAYYCVDAQSGAKVWEAKLVDHPMAYVSSAATLHDGILYVPLSAGRESHRAAPDPAYPCCTGRGALVAVEAATGTVKWRAFMTPDPQPTRKSEVGTQLWGPSGASIWKAPVVDAVKRRIYVTTGQNSSPPATATSDAVVAVDMDSGAIVWSRQITPNDLWNGACQKGKGIGNKENCPFIPSIGGYDLTAPLLKTLPTGGRILIVGDKGGRLVALDPDRDGVVIWDKKVSPGGSLGGVLWGAAADDEHVYVPVHDRFGLEKLTSEVGFVTGGPYKGEAGALIALRLADGAEVWRVSAPADSCKGKPRSCSKAFSSAPTVIPGVVFATAIDGHVRAYATKDGALLWDFDTAREFETLNAGTASGGAIDGPGGVIVVDGTVVLSSGYGAYGTMPGNVLLTFSVDPTAPPFGGAAARPQPGSDPTAPPFGGAAAGPQPGSAGK